MTRNNPLPADAIGCITIDGDRYVLSRVTGWTGPHHFKALILNDQFPIDDTYAAIPGRAAIEKAAAHLGVKFAFNPDVKPMAAAPGVIY